MCLARIADFMTTITGVSLLAVFAWFATREWQLKWFIDLYNMLGAILFILAALILATFLEIVYYREDYQRALKHKESAADQP